MVCMIAPASLFTNRVGRLSSIPWRVLLGSGSMRISPLRIFRILLSSKTCLPSPGRPRPAPLMTTEPVMGRRPSMMAPSWADTRSAAMIGDGISMETDSATATGWLTSTTGAGGSWADVCPAVPFTPAAYKRPRASLMLGMSPLRGWLVENTLMSLCSFRISPTRPLKTRLGPTSTKIRAPCSYRLLTPCTNWTGEAT